MPLRDTAKYRGDWLGLRSLDERGALAVLDCHCSHSSLETGPDRLANFLQQHLLPHLTNR